MTLGKRLEIMIYHFIAFPTQSSLDENIRREYETVQNFAINEQHTADDYDQNR